MTLIAATANLPGGLATLENSHPPQGPFDATMQSRSENWITAFLGGLSQGAGFQIVPVSDALTPPVAITGTANVPKPDSVRGALGNPLVAFAVLAIVGLVAYKAFK